MKSKSLRNIGVLLLLCGVWAAAPEAQEVVDRIAAVVDEEIILLSEVDEMLFTLVSRGQLAVQDSTELEAARREILDRLIEDKLVVHRARSLGLRVSEAELGPRVEEALQEIKENFPSEDAFQEALDAEGVTLTMLRQRYEEQLRNEQLRQMVLGREIRDQVTVTTEDVRAYYDQNRAELPKRADEMHLRHMLFALVDSGKAEDALKEAEALHDAVAGGTPFAQAVEGRQAVTDPQRFCRGDLDPAMEEALADMQPGDTSRPVAGPAGFTVLHMTAREGDCYEVVYAVIPVAADVEAVEKARARAQAARERVLNGEPFSEVARGASDDPATKELGGDMGFVTMDGVPPNIARTLASLPLEQVSEVVEAPDGFHVFQVLARREGGEYAFEEIRPQLRQYLENQRYQEAYDNWLSGVRDTSFVEVKVWSR